MNPYPKPIDHRCLPLTKRILAVLGLKPKLHVDSEHFKEPTAIHVGWCRLHRCYFLDYEHGYKRELWCPLCIEEVLSK